MLVFLRIFGVLLLLTAWVLDVVVGAAGSGDVCGWCGVLRG
jgi:hypothetical protein